MIVFIACHADRQSTYDMGHEYCKKIFEENGGVGIFPRVSCLEGYSLPTFQGVSSTDDTINSQALVGKPSVINLWFVGCPPCEAEVPGLNHLAEKHDSRVNFIAIGRNSEKYLNEFLESNEWNFVHINDPDELIIKNDFNHVWGFPTTFVADKKGVIVKAFSGGRTDSTASETVINKIEPTLLRLMEE